MILTIHEIHVLVNNEFQLTDTSDLQKIQFFFNKLINKDITPYIKIQESKKITLHRKQVYITTNQIKRKMKLRRVGARSNNG